MSIHKLIRDGRKRLGLTEEQFALKVGVSRGAVQQWEKAVTAPKRGNQKAVADLLGISVAELMSTEPDSDNEAHQNHDKNGSRGDVRNHLKQGDDLVIPQYDTGGKMGDGIVLRDQPGVIKSWMVSREWVEKNVHRVTGANNLAIVTGFGDSMQPLYNPGDPLLIDTGVTTAHSDGIYFFRVGDEGFIKRLQRIPGQGILVISDNDKYRDWTIPPHSEDFQIFGKVVKAWCGNDF